MMPLFNSLATISRKANTLFRMLAEPECYRSSDDWLAR
jgi:hypothetical protein